MKQIAKLLEYIYIYRDIGIYINIEIYKEIKTVYLEARDFCPVNQSPAVQLCLENRIFSRLS